MALTPRLTPPAALDIIPGERVAAMIELADRDISELESRAGELSERAERAELEAQAAGVDPEASSWGILRLQRFLDMLREETTRDAAATVDIARHRARLRLDDARNGDATAPPMQVPDVLSYRFEAGTTNGIAPAPTVEALLVEVPPPATTVTEVPIPTAQPEPPSPYAFAAEAPPAAAPNGSSGRSATLVTPVVTPPFADPPPSPAAPAREPVVVETPDETAFWSASPAVAVAVPYTEPHPEPVYFAPPSPTPTPTPPKGAPKPTMLRRIPLSAILEVLAVLAILVFILLRLS